MRRLLVFVVVFILAGAASWAQDIHGTGQWLHDLWVDHQKVDNPSIVDPERTVDLEDSMEYMGYVAGVAALLRDFDVINLANITWGQMAAVVGKYVDAHPEQWNLHAEYLVVAALYQAWPGKAKPPAQ